MKKFLLIVCSAFLVAASVKAQITLEKEYVNQLSAGVTEPIDGERKYYLYSSDNSEIKVYNADHSVYATIAVPNIFDQTWVFLISQELFDTDAGLEALALGYSSRSSDYKKVVAIFEEDGTVILEKIDWGLAGDYENTESFILSTGSESKLLLEGPSDSVAVYSLPGQLEKITAVENPAGAESLQAYPNPASDIVQVAYTIPEGQTQGQLKIYNEQGILVKSFEVDKTFDHLLLNVSDFEQGVYTYRLEGNGFATNTEKLVVMR